MLLVICHLSCHVIGYEGSKCDWYFLIHLLSQLDSHWLLVKWSVVSYQQQSYSGPNTPKWSYSTDSWNDSWVQTFHRYTSYFYLARVNHVQSHGLNQFRAIISCFLRVKINDSMECFFDHLLFVRQIILFYFWTENFVSLKDVLIISKKVNNRKRNESESL